MTSRKRRSDTAIIHTASEASANNTKVESLLASNATAPRIRVRIRRFHGVAHWSWNANDEVCGICQSAFEGTAPGVKYPGEDCPVVWGKCGHAFHLQCVSTWLGQATSRNSCPICRQAWEFGQNPVNTDNQRGTTSNASG
jgi:anaphase-promoting complex subunit 11